MATVPNFPFIEERYSNPLLGQLGSELNYCSIIPIMVVWLLNLLRPLERRPLP